MGYCNEQARQHFTGSESGKPKTMNDYYAAVPNAPTSDQIQEALVDALISLGIAPSTAVENEFFRQFIAVVQVH